MPEISVPDDAPPVLSGSTAWEDLLALGRPVHYDTLPGSEERLAQRIGAAEVALNIRASSKFTGRVLAHCPRLRLISVWGTGTDHVDLAAAARHGVTVTHTPAVSAISVAEHALALLLAAARRIPQADAATRGGEWPRGQGVELHGKTCAVLGMGAIGRQFARLAEGIGMRVVPWTRSGPPLDEVCRTADVISIHLRLSAETEGLIGPRQFALMKPGAILINTARGPVVDEAALIEALSTGRIAAAGLDVFTVEPLPAGHPLARLPNAVLTPHCAGITPEALAAGLRMAVGNIQAFLSGRPTNVVIG